MAEVNQDASAPSSATGTRSGAGFELRLERGGAYVRLADQQIVPGVRLEALTLQVPDVKFPFDVGRGSGQFRSRLCDLAELGVTVSPEVAQAALASAAPASFGIETVEIAFRPGFAELAGRLAGGPAFTLRAGLVPEGERGLAIVFHSPRVYGPAPIAAALLPHTAARLLDAVAGAGLRQDLVPTLLRRVLAPRGWKTPRLDGARLARAELADGAVRIAWERGGPATPPPSPDPDLLAADEGARAFRDAEALLAAGDAAGARERYLGLGPRASAHPFAAERLLALLAADERFHDEALDLAAAWRARRPGFAAALAAEAAIRLARND
ncbi:MAG TPA: hypothetical protein VM753_07835, partial [Anaeromyxobacter sp.]|nr:hypothetical protein [Anaeromyxobacter sp.]